MPYASMTTFSILTALLMACSSGKSGPSAGGDQQASSPQAQALLAATGTWVSARSGSDGFYQVTLSVSEGRLQKASLFKVSPGSEYGVDKAISSDTLSESLPVDGVALEVKNGGLKARGLRSMTENLAASLSFENVDRVKWSGYSPGSMSKIRVKSPAHDQSFLLTIQLPIGFSAFSGYPQVGISVDRLYEDVFTFGYSRSYGYQSSTVFADSSPTGSDTWIDLVTKCATPQTITVAAGTFKTCFQEQADEFKVWLGNVPGGVVRLERLKPDPASLPSGARDVLMNAELNGIQSWELEAVIY